MCSQTLAFEEEEEEEEEEELYMRKKRGMLGQLFFVSLISTHIYYQSHRQIHACIDTFGELVLQSKCK